MVPKDRQSVVVEHLEKYAVMDEVEFSQPDFGIFSISGPNTRKFLEEKFGQELRPHSPFEHQQLDWNGTGVPLLQHSFTGETGFLIFAKDVDVLLKKIDPDSSLVELGPDVQDILRIESGIPRWGTDCSESTLFPEMNLQTETVSYTKGCFVGQGDSRQSEIPRCSE